MARIPAAIVLGSALIVSGCVVVPLNPDGSYPYSVGAAPAAPVVIQQPVAQTLPVRLYPTNDAASATGVIAGTVTNHLNGKGTFSLNVGNETMSGEATRQGNTASARNGIANAYGARGSHANCRYTMNSVTQGTGSCTFSNGASYQLHIGT